MLPDGIPDGVQIVFLPVGTLQIDRFSNSSRRASWKLFSGVSGVERHYCIISILDPKGMTTYDKLAEKVLSIIAERERLRNLTNQEFVISALLGSGRLWNSL